MTQCHRLLHVLMLALALGQIAPVPAQSVPTSFSYQGFLIDAAGHPATGPLTMTFSLYDQAEDGIPLWQETLAPVTVLGGFFQVELGREEFLGPELFESPLFLGISIDGDPEIAPRSVVGSVPFARFAEGLLACGVGQTNCGGICADLQSDPQNCGNCESSCVEGLSCDDGQCVEPPRCDDGIQNGHETDVDCGGPDCATCENDKMCQVDSDCQSDFCDWGFCTTQPEPKAFILPNPSFTTSTLTCNAAFDSDGPFSYVWRVNSIQVGTTGATLSPDNFVKGNTVSCEASDGSQSGSGQIVISNSPPVVSNWLIDGAPFLGGNINCEATAVDADGDGLTMTYLWLWSADPFTRIDGPALFIDPNRFSAGQDLTCWAYAFDGEEFGTCGPDLVFGECPLPPELVELLPTVTIVEPEP